MFNVVVFLTSLAIGSYTFFVPIYAKTMGATYYDLGIIGAAAALPYALLAFIFGHMNDRFRNFWPFMLGILTIFTSTALLFTAHNIEALVLIRAIGGIGLAIFWPSADAYVARAAHTSGRVREFGIYSMAWASGYLIGPIIGGFAVESVDASFLFLVASISLALALSMGFVSLFRNDGRDWKEQEEKILHFPPENRKSRAVIFVFVFLYANITSIIQTIFPGYVSALGVSVLEVGILFTIYFTTRVASFSMAERLNKAGLGISLLIGSLLMSFFIYSVGIVSSYLLLTIIMLGAGAGTGMVYPLMMNAAAKLFSLRRSGLSMGLFESMFGIGQVTGPYIGGFVANNIDPHAPFTLCGVLGAVMVCLAILVPKRKSFSRGQMPA
jgi:MFS family permease